VEVDEQHKRCKVCGEVKPIDDFYRSEGMRDGHRNDCKPCNLKAAAARHAANPQPARERARRWQEANPERFAENQARYRAEGRRRIQNRRYHLKRKFGITLEAYDALLGKQGGTCAICRRPPRADISLHVDHDHETGAVRGLLCFDCNAGLGKFADDAALLEAARRYLSG
jgi:5-methylcytosine-specific restriction endonuclease McrA